MSKEAKGYCPFCDEHHDAAPCPSPGEIAMACTRIQQERAGELGPDKEIVVEVEELGKGIILS